MGSISSWQWTTVAGSGALRFRDEAGVFQRATEPGRRTAPPLLELRHLLSASRAVETETETAADLAYLRGAAPRSAA